MKTCKKTKWNEIVKNEKNEYLSNYDTDKSHQSTGKLRFGDVK